MIVFQTDFCFRFRRDGGAMLKNMPTEVFLAMTMIRSPPLSS